MQLLCKRAPGLASAHVGRRTLCIVQARTTKRLKKTTGLDNLQDEIKDGPADLNSMPLLDVEVDAPAVDRGVPEANGSQLMDELVAKETALSSASTEAPEATPEAKPRRTRRTSRKATATADPIHAAPADAETETASKPTRRTRKASRGASTAVEEDPAGPAAAAAAATAAPAPAKRGRRKSAAIEPEAQPAQEAVPTPLDAPATEVEVLLEDAVTAAPAGVAASPVPTKRGRRTSRKSAAIEPEAAAPAPLDAPSAEVDAMREEEGAAPAKPQRARRSSRRSAALDVAASGDAADAAVAAPRARRSSRRSATVAAEDGLEVTMSESQLGKMTKDWLQARLAERGIYDSSIHTTKPTMVEALLAGNGPPAAQETAPAAPAPQDAQTKRTLSAAKALASRMVQRELQQHAAAPAAASAALAAAAAAAATTAALQEEGSAAMPAAAALSPLQSSLTLMPDIEAPATEQLFEDAKVVDEEWEAQEQPPAAELLQEAEAAALLAVIPAPDDTEDERAPLSPSAHALELAVLLAEPHADVDLSDSVQLSAGLVSAAAAAPATAPDVEALVAPTAEMHEGEALLAPAVEQLAMPEEGMGASEEGEPEAVVDVPEAAAAVQVAPEVDAPAAKVAVPEGAHELEVAPAAAVEVPEAAAALAAPADDERPPTPAFEDIAVTLAEARNDAAAAIEAAADDARADVVLGAFDRAGAAFDRAGESVALAADEAAVAAEVSKEGAAVVEGAEGEDREHNGFMAQVSAWLQQIKAMFEEWKKSLRGHSY